MVERINAVNGSPFALVLSNNPTQGLPLENIFLLCDSSAGPINILLPKAETFPGRNVKIYVSDVTGSAATHPITITVDPSDKINGTGTYTILNNYDFARVCVTSENLFTATGSGGSSGVIPVTYNQLMSLAGANNLAAGSYYLITDFKMVTYIQFSGGGIGSEDIHTGATEPMLALAATSNSFAPNIISTVNPLDEITWKATFADRDWDAVLGQSTGVITSRYDTVNYLLRDYDWRNIIFRRWETVNGSGVFDSFLPTAFNFQDFPPFPALSLNASIGSPLQFGPSLGSPYMLDNTVSYDICAEIDIHIAFGNTVFNFFSNDAKLFFQNVITDCSFNQVGAISQCTAEDVSSNQCIEIATNTAVNITSNNVTFIGDNSLNAGDIRENTGNSIRNNVSTISGASIISNNVGQINGNSEFTNIIQNTGEQIFQNVNCDIQENIVSAITVNQCAGGVMNIRYNNGYHIVGNTSADNIDLTFNNVATIVNNIFADLYIFAYNSGNQADRLNFTGAALPVIFQYNSFNTLSQVTILATIQNNLFTTNIFGPISITPTPSMTSAGNSITTYDTALGNVEQVLTAGVLSYTAF